MLTLPLGRGCTLLALLLSASAAAQTPAPPPEAAPTGQPPLNGLRSNLEGRVVVAGTRQPLAQVQVQVDGTSIQTRTAADGSFILRGVPSGKVFVSFQKLGFERISIQVPVEPGRGALGVFYLHRQTDIETGKFAIEVVENRTTEVLQHSFTMEEVRSTPGTLGDAVRVVQNLPGIARAPFGLGLTLVRGTGPNDSGFYLDGLSVPIIFHFGGLISVYSSSMLDSVNYLPGGYSVRYGRNLGGVIDVETRDALPERNGGYADINLLDSSAFFSGKQGQLGYAIAARRSYIDFLANPLLENTTGILIQFPRYWDAQAKLDYIPNDVDNFQLFFAASDDRFAVLGNAGEGADEDSANSAGFSTYTTTFRGKLSWSRRLGTLGHNRMDLAVGPNQQNAQFGAGTLERTPILVSLRDELSLNVQPWLGLKLGLDAETIQQNLLIDLGGGSEGSDEGTLVETSDWTYSPSPYVEADVLVGEDLHITPGLRLDPLWIPDLYGAVALDPRLAFRFKPLPGLLLKGSTGKYSQFPNYNELLEELGNPELKPAYAWQNTLGFEWDITPQLYLDMVGYYNQLQQLVVSNQNLPFGAPGGGGGGDNDDDEDTATADETEEDTALYTNEGLGRTYGLELLLRKRMSDRLYGWISYTLARSERRREDEEDWTLYSFDQTHNLTLVAGYRLKHGWELSARYRFGSGNPFTPVLNASQDLDDDSWEPVYGETNSARNDFFSQLDVRVQKDWTFNTWALQGYLDIQNVTNRSNPEASFYNFDFRDQSQISGLPILPVLGFRGTF